MIVIPMAGMSRRFTEAGYRLPKYMLPLQDRPVFDHAIGSFARYFADTPFLFIARDVENTQAFIDHRCRALGIADFQTIILSTATAGQAETVELGLLSSHARAADPLTIFNIDTFRPDFQFPDSYLNNSAGYLEVFRGTGDNWSYVRPSLEHGAIAVEVAEKRPISDLCCTGLYHFSRTDLFRAALRLERDAPSANELYVAPLYNHLINRGDVIRYHEIDASRVIFCGVPSEYIDLGGHTAENNRESVKLIR